MDVVTLTMAAVAEQASDAHWAEIGIVGTNLGLILVTLWLAYLTSKALHSEQQRSSEVANNSIDSMEAVAKSVVDHHRH